MNNSAAWRPPVDGLAYAVQFDEELTDELAAHHAQRLLDKPIDPYTQQEQYDALAYAAADGDDLGRFAADSHSEADLRDFLSKVVTEMDHQRPWTPPPLQPLRLERWDALGAAPPVAALRLSVTDAMQRLGYTFDDDPDEGREICLLGLANGFEIVLVADYWPETGNMAVLTHAAEPRQVIEYLLANTNLNEHDFVPVE